LSMKPALQAVQAYLASRGLDKTSSPVLFTSPETGIADGGKHTSNWYVSTFSDFFQLFPSFFNLFYDTNSFTFISPHLFTLGMIL